MDQNIPTIIDALYRYFVTAPSPDFWPDYFLHNPVQGLRLGIQLADACLEKL